MIRGMLGLGAAMAAGLVLAAAQAQAANAPAAPDAARIDLHWGVKIPLRDGVKLNATGYTP
jgi:hypothetical protein